MVAYTVASRVTGEAAAPGMRSGGAVSGKRLRRFSRSYGYRDNLANHRSHHRFMEPSATRSTTSYGSRASSALQTR